MTCSGAAATGTVRARTAGSRLRTAAGAGSRRQVRAGRCGGDWRTARPGYAWLVRLTTRPLEADAEPWDPSDPEPFKALAGSQFIGTDGDLAVFRGRDGCVGHAHPGWLAVRIDGAGDGEAIFMTPDHAGEGRTAVWVSH